MTSFRIVSKVRGILCHKLGIKEMKVGHAGTLDPLATGVLIVCTGKATKEIDRLQSGRKEYIATLKIGATTPSFDMETEEDATYPIVHINRRMVENVLKRFVGSIEQVPPTFSAVKIDGKRAYKMARKGKGSGIELKSKTLVIDEIELLSYDIDSSRRAIKPQAINIKTMTAEEAALISDMTLQPTITIRIVCSKGTYIRALARDIGLALGSGAYLASLTRTRVGDYTIQESLDINTFEQYVDDALKDNPNTEK